MKKKIRLMGIAVGLLIASIVGGSIAFFSADSDARNTISAGNLGVELQLDEGADTKNIKNNNLVGTGAVPGSVFEYPIHAYNSGDYDSYIRITLTRYWEDANSKEKNFDADASKIELVNLKDNNDWIIDDQDENKEVVYCYYKKPVASHTATSNVIDAIKIGSLTNKDQDLYTTLQVKVDVEVDAIQKVAAQDAILAEWGLDVEFDDNGNIITVEE